uniref:Ribosomal RNA-processing protein 7 C-terminal domain-containing protein n=1 Tax=Eutreptiella gymnastica TaxID=73025 RepID=A0A7S4CMW5_9EUGL
MEQQQPNPNPSKKKRKRMMTEADDEGWTTVVRTRGPMSGLQRDAPEEDAVRARKDDELRKGERNMGKQADFYTFQLSALKAKRIGRMAKKFLSNKNKIELMKAQRKFTPY